MYHNPRPRSEHGCRPRFARHDSAVVRRIRYPSGEGLLELDDALAIFAARRFTAQRLCLDVKDAGFEEAHITLARRHGVEASIIWMSWVPESLARLRQLGASGPLVLAHCNLLRFWSLGDWLDAACARLELRMSHIVLRGARHAHRLPQRAHGFQHGLLCARLPATVERLLVESGGGVCVHRSLLSGALQRYCRDTGLQLWVFRASTPAAYTRFAIDRGIDMVFCDDAPGVLGTDIAAECYATQTVFTLTNSRIPSADNSRP